MKQDTRQLTANFSISEVACRCGLNCDAAEMQESVMFLLQRLRDLYNKPMRISSARRCRSWNKEVGGSKNSKHLHGLAVDILVFNDADRYELVRLAMSLGFNGIGVGKNFVHLDARSSWGALWGY
jgi:zinc D-Ala-D-Ala carboxypeptidase